jgi:hypothetical protein
MMTVILQMLVLLACAFLFAWYVLYLDKKDKRDARQREIYFPTHRNDEERDQRGVAMSRL